MICKRDSFGRPARDDEIEVRITWADEQYTVFGCYTAAERGGQYCPATDAMFEIAEVLNMRGNNVTEDFAEHLDAIEGMILDMADESMREERGQIKIDNLDW